MRKAISWNPVRLEDLRKARLAAIERRDKVFTTKITDQGTHEFDVAYAGHLIQYLDQEFAANPPVVVPPNREGKEGE